MPQYILLTDEQLEHAITCASLKVASIVAKSRNKVDPLISYREAVRLSKAAQLGGEGYIKRQLDRGRISSPIRMGSSSNSMKKLRREEVEQCIEDDIRAIREMQKLNKIEL